jgi:DNA-binding response OmpR family regulator
MRLLVVEDEARISELIKAALERAEFAVDTVRLRADARAEIHTVRGVGYLLTETKG